MKKFTQSAKQVTADAAGSHTGPSYPSTPSFRRSAMDILGCLLWIGDRLHHIVGWRTKSFRRQDDILSRRGHLETAGIESNHAPDAGRYYDETLRACAVNAASFTFCTL